MKNLMSYGLFSLLSFALLISCSESDSSKASEEEEYINYLEENMVITSVNARSVSQSAFVKEVQIIDFAKTSKLKPVFGANDVIYKDDGTANDLVAGDGLYTSETSFDHNEAVEFTNYQSVVISEGVALPKRFKHQDKLEKYLAEKKGGNQSEKVELIGISCSVGFIQCSQGGNCLACYVYDASCYYLYDCRVEFGL